MNKFKLLLLLIVPSLAVAQAPRGFSISAGVNQTSLKSKDLLADPGTGFKVGTVFNFGYHETYNYQVEAFYNSANLKLKSVDQNYENVHTSKYTYNTIDLGVYGNYYILKPDEDKFYCGLQGGLTFAIAGQLVPAKGADTGNEKYLPYLLNESSFQNMPKINYNAGLGLTGGYNDFRFDLRYSMGLNNVLKEVETDSHNENNIYTGPTLTGKINTISFTLSYRINKLFGGE
jgi:hypothetical protein